MYWPWCQATIFLLCCNRTIKYRIFILFLKSIAVRRFGYRIFIFLFFGLAYTESADQPCRRGRRTGAFPMSPATPLPTLRQSLAVILPTIFLFSTMETWLFPALPLIQKAVGASPAAVNWIFTGLLLSGAVSTPIVGKLGDIHGKHAMFFWVLAITCLGVLCSATASGIVALAIGQALQGVGLSLVPLSIGIIRDSAGERGASTANGLVIGAATASTTAGLLFAGPMVEHLPYQALFWLPLVGLSACTLAAARLFLPSAQRRSGEALDWPGALLLSATILALLLAITMIATRGWRSPVVLGLAALGALLFYCWIQVERRARAPLLDLATLRRREVWSTCGVAFFIGFGSIAGYVIVPPLVQMAPAGGIGFNASVAQTGWFLLPLGVLGTVAAPLVGPLERRLGASKVLFAGCAMIVVGLLGIGMAHTEAWPIVAGMGCIGVGVGFALTQVMNFAARASGGGDAASLAAIVYLSRSFGGATGAQVAGAMLEGGLQARAADTFGAAFMLCALVTAASLMFCACLPAPALRRHPA
jgi:MFS family permease